MASKIFLDANILLDLTLKRGDHESAKRIIELSVSGRVQAYITSSILTICWHWLTKAYGNAKAKELLLGLLADIKLIDTEHETVLNALLSKITDIEDAIQYYAALRHRMDFFISSDKQLQKQAIPVLPVYSAKDFLKEF